jgi:uncharacterized protein YkwD
MTSLFPRRAMRHLDFRMRTYGITAVLGLFSIGGALPQCAPPPPPPPVVEISGVQQEVVRSVNGHRANMGLRPVTVDARLNAAAQAHSDHMARARTMTHVGAGGTNAGQRISDAGYRWQTWAENVAAGHRTPTQVMAAWMNSPGHRANILNGRFTQIGIAATKAPNGPTYWTMVLAAP